jgi:hypothetical protein
MIDLDTESLPGVTTRRGNFVPGRILPAYGKVDDNDDDDDDNDDDDATLVRERLLVDVDGLVMVVLVLEVLAVDVLLVPEVVVVAVVAVVADTALDLEIDDPKPNPFRSILFLLFMLFLSFFCIDKREYAATDGDAVVVVVVALVVVVVVGTGGIDK